MASLFLKTILILLFSTAFKSYCITERAIKFSPHPLVISYNGIYPEADYTNHRRRQAHGHIALVMDFITSNIINKKKATKTKAKAIETQVGSDKDNRILISQNNVDAIGELERYIESCNLKNMYCFLRYSVDLNSDTPKKFTHEKRPRSAKAYCKLLDCNEREDYKEDQEYRCLSESFFNKNIMYIKPKNDLHAELSIAYYLQSMYIKKNIDDLIEAITGTKVRCYDCARKLGANEELYGRPRIGRSFRRLTHDSKTDYLTPGNYCVETERFYTRARSTSPCKQP